ncbi:PREDICTED: myosin-binding [Prunus dulcis]|uniref:PREDICTED: myosin-binding n=1 Tax=Prunus dulcis TaxID=3755 RepID=A0A5E4EWU0_PRUDU|nr:PREDICTED: myosin-binding [Prunus dulcis]
MSHVGGYTELRVCSNTDSARCPGKIGWDPLSHVGYTELKISSDSEFPFSEDDDGSSFISGIHEPKREGFVVQCVSKHQWKSDDSKASEVKVLGANVAVENTGNKPVGRPILLH